MRSPLLTLFTLVAVAACTTQQARRTDTTSPAAATLAGAPATDAAASKAIQAADSAQAAALIRGDTTGVAAYYTDDAIVLPPNDQLAKGHDAIVKAIGNIFAAGKITAFATHREDLLVTGDYAIETLSYEMTIQPKTGKSMSDKGKGLTVFKKQPDGSYKAIRDVFNSDLAAK